MRKIVLFFIVSTFLFTAPVFAQTKYYCEYCGTSTFSVATLTGGSCPRHPNGPNQGKHKLYEGDEKKQYVCKYCGTKTFSISTLTSGFCPRHPDGMNKGRHSPAR